MKYSFYNKILNLDNSNYGLYILRDYIFLIYFNIFNILQWYAIQIGIAIL